VRLRLHDGDGAISAHTVSFRVQVLAQAWTPVRRLEVGDTLTGDDVVAREVDLVREPKAVLADEAVFSRYEMARNTSTDRTLVWSDLAPRALVRKGQIVEVVANEGVLSISMKGQATHSGALGEVVTVRNLESKREFPAEVVDENKVRVHF
jgi:flagella basal body P-ring formation protein FlgA